MPTKHNTMTPECIGHLMNATATIVAATLNAKTIGIGAPRDVAELVREVAAALRESAQN
jgi:hypothetical protein